MQIKFLSDSSALLIDEKYLVIADLHLGLELELARKGIMVPNQLPKFQEKIDRLIKETGAKEFIILGDVKHEYKGISWTELRDVPEFLKNLQKKVKVRIIKGNHDGGIEAIAPAGVKVYEPTGFVLEDVALTHGAAWPKISALSTKTLIMGHIHPAIEFWSSGARMTEHIWIKAKINRAALEKKYKMTARSAAKCMLEQAIIVPTFNHLAGGVAFNSESFKPQDPLLKNAIDWKNAEVFLLDGTALGNMTALRSKAAKELSKIKSKK